MHCRLLFLLLLLPLVGCASQKFDEYNNLGADTNYRVAPFTLTERSGKSVRLEDLRGKVWVASFFFSCCSRACGPMNANLSELHKSLTDRPDIVLVSISVYPELDTPKTLQAYAKALDASPERWLFLTGSEKEIYKLTRESFMQPVIKNETVHNIKAAGTALGLCASAPILAAGVIQGSPTATIDPALAVDHTSYLTVVDRNGRIRAILMDGTKPKLVEYLGVRVRALDSMFPALNASLNATCGLLLVLGYLAIRWRRETLHKALMLSAVGVSAVFLACYLYYHLIVMRGAHTVFLGDGPARTVYFAVLLSHTVLAAIVAPLALYTGYVGLRDRRMRHVRLARWTLPIWLYVSVTGVVVYLMLYHLYPSA